jgi:starch-binding outer membrane protein, SusD/RagB family
MNRNKIQKWVLASILGTGIISCTKDLDRTPTNDLTSEIVYSTMDGYKKSFAKVYAAFALTGNEGPAGQGDVQGIDEGTSDFVRLLWWVQEISTDEAVVQAGWNDPGVHNFHNMTWSADNVITAGIYYRSFYQITLVNEFLRQSTDEKLAQKGFAASTADSIRAFRNEARFLRAYQYSIMMDLFGNVPFADENLKLGTELPKQIKRADLFEYVESELKDLETILPAARTNEYGRADRGAAMAILARIYLNAEVYTGTQRNTDAMTYAKKVIDAGYSLIPDYRHLMLADNHLNKSEFILTVNYDGVRTQNYGGTTFLTHAPVGGSMAISAFGINEGWAGVRTTKNLPQKFPDVNGIGDKRAMFHTSGQSMELSADPAPSFTEGYAITKFKNITRTGAQGSNPAFADTDFPLIRLAEMYLIYAEAAIRTNTNLILATDYINLLRDRADADLISTGDLNLSFILDERSRELYWEGFRRSDLIRHNKFVEGTYLWPWKGGVSNGTAVASYRKLFPIPSSDINSNTNLVQNLGY